MTFNLGDPSTTLRVTVGLVHFLIAEFRDTLDPMGLYLSISTKRVERGAWRNLFLFLWTLTLDLSTPLRYGRDDTWSVRTNIPQFVISTGENL